MRLRSLRLRLTFIILTPLVLLAVAVGLWQVRAAQRTAQELFDRSLLTTALAIVGDVARSGGDALSIETRDLLSDTSGGPVFYHVYAPDGVYVTGFATPPVSPAVGRHDDGVVFFDGRYNHRAVRGLRMTDVATLDGISGVYTYTVWQDVAVRTAFTWDLIFGTALILCIIIGTLAVVVWFGVGIGLRPLLDLEDAIARRGPNDLGPIQRPVPTETIGMVRRLNTLFRQVADAMEAQKSLISNAAHQLRNPIAGVLAMAEAVRSAPNAEQVQKRTGELLRSARHASDLANKLLTLERVQSGSADLKLDEIEIDDLIEEVMLDYQSELASAGVRFLKSTPPEKLIARLDRVLMREALGNLVHNSLTHGGPGLSEIEVSARLTEAGVQISVRDDGRGVDASRHQTVLARFGQAEPSEGSGLGLSIAETIAERHRGSLTLSSIDRGLTVAIHLPGGYQRPTA